MRPVIIIIVWQERPQKKLIKNYSKGRQVVRDMGDIETLLANQKQRGEYL